MAGSWQNYIDNSLIGTKCVTHAAIHGIDGGVQWASSSGFAVSVCILDEALARFPVSFCIMDRL